MAEGAVTFLLEQVKEVVKGYGDLISTAESELLKKEFDLLKAFLKETKKEKDIRYIELKGRIREVVYEVEDIMDTCLTTNHSSLAIAKAVKSIREDKVLPLMDAVGSFAEMQRTADAAGAMEIPQAKRRRDTPIRQERIVGFEEQEEMIAGHLKGKTEHLDVISIVGMPGLGKTTLAWKIYNSEVICFRFPIRIWVYISQSFDIRDVFLQILRKFTPSKDVAYLNDYELAQTVGACLEKEIFLLVLDDVWSVDAWNLIKEVLPLHNGEGKVLITTREMDVGKRCSVYRKPYELRSLDNDESWRLLQYEVFGNLDDCPEELRDIGYLIAIKCDGVPLAIVMIGGFLVYKFGNSLSLSVWEMVSENVTEALLNNEFIIAVVGLSFDRLTDELRECFLFLGVFPEDYEIPAKMICGLWIVEGFVVARNRESLEDRAEENMNDLIRRNLLNVGKTNRMGKVKTCRVHSMIRAFCISKSKDENLFQDIKRSRQGIFRPQDSKERNSHRLCLSSDLSEFLSEKPRGPQVRSFLCFHDQPVYLEPELISVIPDAFKKLRILESKCIMFNQFPAELTKLLHLRYLTLYIQTLEILPESITRLRNLQSLVIETKSRSTTMEANMWRMVQLRCLKTRSAIVLDNKWEGEAGQNLLTLNRVAPESCTEAVSRRAKNLKTLGISGKLACVFQTDFLENLHALEKLKLENRISNGLPQRNCFPPNLKRLTLTNTCVGWKHMSTLAMMKSLEVLKLKNNAFVGALWRVYGYDFPSLQLLLMVNTNLFQWEVSTDAVPNLRFLVVNNCENLREIPECLGESLERLEIYHVRHSVVESAVKIAKTNEGKPKGKFGVEFNLTMDAVWTTQVEPQSNILFS